MALPIGSSDRFRGSRDEEGAYHTYYVWQGKNNLGTPFYDRQGLCQAEKKQPVTMSFGGAPKCPKCTKSVYMAEEVKCAGKSFHKACFTCATCRKSLDATTVSEHDSNVYCKACYTKQFGPKGYGYGVGAGTLAHTGGDVNTLLSSGEPMSDDSTSIPVEIMSQSEMAAESSGIQPRNVGYVPQPPKISTGGAEFCGKCNKTVYQAERAIAAGRVWHKKCFLCSSCNRTLDSSTLQDKDSQLFCNPCYKKNFGPKGFRGGVAGGMEHTT